jgi:type I restriction-modification system DNA methylase subunit
LHSYIDPACGATGFLSYAAKHLQKSGVSSDKISQQIFGIEKDRYLAKLDKAHLAITTLSESNIL